MQKSILKGMVTTKYYLALGKCHYQAHVVVLPMAVSSCYCYLTLTACILTHTLTGAMVGILAWMALKRLLAETQGPIKEETVVDHKSQSMV